LRPVAHQMNFSNAAQPVRQAMDHDGAAWRHAAPASAPAILGVRIGNVKGAMKSAIAVPGITTRSASVSARSPSVNTVGGSVALANSASALQRGTRGLRFGVIVQLHVWTLSRNTVDPRWSLTKLDTAWRNFVPSHGSARDLCRDRTHLQYRIRR
jgi:hypothetical protein